MSGTHRARLLCASICFAACASESCSSTVSPGPQLLVVIDTDAPVVGQLADHADLSPDAAIDTLRIEVFDANDQIIDQRLLVVPDESNWPVSFGIRLPDGGWVSNVRVRARAFRGLFAVPGDQARVRTLDPRPEVTIDRVVDLTMPTDGELRVGVLLTMDCMGVLPSFLAPATTCTDASHPSSPPSSGVTVLGGPNPTKAGTWTGAKEIACSASGDDGHACIPGGFSLLGETSFVGAATLPAFEPVPLRPVRLSPFLIDVTEFTVGEFRTLVRSGAFKGTLPATRVANDPCVTIDDRCWNFCTWLGPSDSSHDSLPLNCVTWDTASAVCKLSGGSLPSEAQWEHAARGRGQRRIYPWGNDTPECCTSSAARVGASQILTTCPGSGPEPIGSHPASDSCGGLGDVSRDGVLDLGGSLTEALVDSFAAYADPCWQSTGVPLDPVCVVGGSKGHSARGGYWNSGIQFTAAPWRQRYGDTPSVIDGFRCVYPGRPQ